MEQSAFMWNFKTNLVKGFLNTKGIFMLPVSVISNQPVDGISLVQSILPTINLMKQLR